MGKTARDIMTSDVTPIAEITIGADDSIEEALQTMKRHQVRRLPVIDGNEMVGIIAQADVAKHVKEERTGETVEAISQ